LIKIKFVGRASKFLIPQVLCTWIPCMENNASQQVLSLSDVVSRGWIKYYGLKLWNARIKQNF